MDGQVQRERNRIDQMDRLMDRWNINRLQLRWTNGQIDTVDRKTSRWIGQ